MRARTNADCTKCIHGKVCGRAGRPNQAVKTIHDFNGCDDEGLDIVVSCIDYEANVVGQIRSQNYKNIKIY